MITSFEPIINRDSEIIILGSFPGEISLSKNEYYANKMNQFWKIIYDVYCLEFDYPDYEKKKIFLHHNKIALWDVIYSCERVGSLDSKIKNAVPNNFPYLLSQYENISRVYFNGGTAEKYFMKFFRKRINEDIMFKKLNFYKLPSTSPANTIKYNLKLDEWIKIKE